MDLEMKYNSCSCLEILSYKNRVIPRYDERHAIEYNPRMLHVADFLSRVLILDTGQVSRCQIRSILSYNNQIPDSEDCVGAL